MRLWCVEKFYTDLLRLYTKYHCDAIFDLGDTFDSRSYIDILTLDSILEQVYKLPKSKYNRRIIGNHDQYLKSNSISNSKVLQQIFDTVEDRRIEYFDDTACFFVSYPSDYKDTAKWIKSEADKLKCRKLLFGHFQIKGARLLTAEAATGMPLDVLTGFDQVLLGHIHIAQSLTDRIHYVGDPYQQNWGEAGQTKRVGLLDIGDSIHLKWINLSGYPEYRDVDFDTFKKQVNRDEEHRYRVSLRSQDETQSFFSNPLSDRAVGTYVYDVEKESKSEHKDTDWSLDSILSRYVDAVPANFDVSKSDLIDAGKMLIND
jgi:DNA repair exonuclease SbcCD nuclease subunit